MWAHVVMGRIKITTITWFMLLRSTKLLVGNACVDSFGSCVKC